MKCADICRSAFQHLLFILSCIFFIVNLVVVCTSRLQSRSVVKTCHWRRTDWRTQTTPSTSLRRRSTLVTTMNNLTTERTERTSNAQRLVDVLESGVTKSTPVTVPHSWRRYLHVSSRSISNDLCFSQFVHNRETWPKFIKFCFNMIVVSLILFRYMNLDFLVKKTIG